MTKIETIGTYPKSNLKDSGPLGIKLPILTTEYDILNLKDLGFLRLLTSQYKFDIKWNSITNPINICNLKVSFSFHLVSNFVE